MYLNEIELNKELIKLEENFLKEFSEINDITELLKLESKYVGKKSLIFGFLQQINNLNQEEQKELKKKIFFLKQKFVNLLKDKKTLLENKILDQKLKEEKIDISIPSLGFPQGSLHPLNQIIRQIENFFLGLGYSIYEGNEIETDLYNFELLNMSKYHTARDMQDSFYLNLNPELLLRTHTSGIQIRSMQQNRNQTLKIISSGKVYRRDKDDDTHSHQFTQLEGLFISPTATFINLKETITSFLRHIFGQEQKLRFRPSYFPFTRPSFEVDLVIIDKNQKKIYLEVLGAGLVHPQVLSNGGFDNTKFKGFAFGIGIERIAMLKYKIDNIRHFYNNDIRFLNQFI
ncbi:phenylalanine--tRNA ligase subunit alpha ['Camptotheca acuminata' phytoplasma]|uniref:phenylalanine--tRNA ligase subunit alpha n=1 Tax='Camptotheca acuminata' phytoplasma TaxID=3239192 RepID=UPI003519FC14